MNNQLLTCSFSRISYLYQFLGIYFFYFLFDSAQVSSQIVSTKSSDYVLVGSLYPSPEEEGLDAPTPITILHKFEYGFPDEWQALITHWRTYNQKEKYDFHK